MTDLSEQQRLWPAAQQAAAPAARVAAAERVVFDQVGKTYRAGGVSVQALQDVHFGIRAGEVFGIIGRSGAGKSTLLRTINRLESPSSGRVLVNGTDVATLDERALRGLRRRIGMIFQHFNLLSAKTVWENVALPLRVAGVPRAAIEQRAGFLLDLVGLADKRDAYPAKLSGGQKQRVGIARALVHEPDILLCDEATSALDPETTQSILALLRDINRRLGLTVVLITHEMAVIREICDRVAVLEQGRVVELDEVWRVFGAPQSQATHALLRPLVHALPQELARGLVPVDPAAPLSPQWPLLLELQLSGARAREFDFAALAGALGGPVELLHGGIDRIQGRPQGRLVVAVRGVAGDARALLQTLERSVDGARILGRRTGDPHAA